MIFTRREYEEICGISRANYNTYRDARGRIIESLNEKGEVVIDTSNPVNLAFYERRQDIVKSKLLNPEISFSPISTNKKKTVPVTKTKGKAQVVNKKQEPDTSTSKRYQLEIDKLEKENRQKDLKIALDELKVATLSGNNVPMPIVLQMFSQLSRSLLVGYKDFSEQMISKFCHKNKIPDSEKIKLIAELVSGLNSTHTKSVDMARNHMKKELKTTNIKESLLGTEDNDDSE